MSSALIEAIDLGAVISPSFRVLEASTVTHWVVLYTLCHCLILSIGTVVLAGQIGAIRAEVGEGRVTEAGFVLFVAFTVLTAVHGLLLLDGIDVNED